MSIADARLLVADAPPPLVEVAATYRDERTTVIGPNAPALLAPARNEIRRWPYFAVCAIPWFFYRKMYVAGAAGLVTAIIFAVHLPLALLPFAATKAAVAQPLYRRFVRSRIAKADARALTGDARHDYLRRAGGTSVIAAAFAMSVILPLLVAAAYLAVTRTGVA